MDLDTQKLLIESITQANKSKISPYSTKGVVKSVKGDTAYVIIDGSDRTTPITSKSANVRPGDIVNVSVSHSDTHITGNRTDYSVGQEEFDALSDKFELNESKTNTIAKQLSGVLNHFDDKGNLLVYDSIKYILISDDTGKTVSYYPVEVVGVGDWGADIAYGAGGAVILGSGESAKNLYDALGLATANETTFISSDNTIRIFTNCNTIANRVEAINIANNGSITLAKALPIASGGSGQTAISRTTTISDIAVAESGWTIRTAGYASWGKLAQLYLSLTNTNALTAGNVADTKVATVVAGKRPSITVCNNSANVSANFHFNQDGSIYLNELARNCSAGYTGIAVSFTYILP